MNPFRNLFVAFVLAMTIFQPLPAQEKLPDGVLFELVKQKDTDPRWMKIQVCSEDIVRVIAGQERTFSVRPSIMAAKTTWSAVPWSMKENGENIEISTSRLVASVNRQNGAVTFHDSKGHLLLGEKTGGGKSIIPADVLGEKTSHVRQYFRSTADEAFYGLGAHQNGIMNYKGSDVDLWQYNIVDVNPFLISSKNYGILWDNNSNTKFGDVREYQSISNLALYGADGREGGLTAEYFRDSSCSALFTSRVEPRIEHEFIDVNDEYPAGFAENVAVVRWSGSLSPAVSGVHKFQLFCSGYTRMWLDGKLVVDSWRQNWLPWTHIPRLAMEAGKRYTITIEWRHSGGYIGLKYLPPDPEEQKDLISLYSEVADQIEYYFIGGNNLDDVIGGYREITGKAPMMPKWAMGMWQCRERYKSQDEVLSTVKEFRKRQIPLDNIVQDWFYWKEDQWGSHDFDATRYPNPEGMVKELHEDLHAHIMISVWPKFYVGTKHYDEMKEKGWLYMRNVEKKQRDWVGPGYLSTFYDPYSTGARELYWKRVDEKLFSKGFDAWWLDSVEPDMQSDLSRTETILRQGPTAMGSASRYLNTYSIMNAQAVYEGQRKSAPDQRVFILTRSAFAGQQRYSAATWSGDIAARWYDLRTQIPAGLNFCMAGIPYWTTDIGGFAVEPRFERPGPADTEEWCELMTRWFQFGTFCPIFRIHGQFPYREMYEVAPESHPAYRTMLAYDRLRYRLMPYIYSLTGMVTHKDYTVMRALVMDFGHDKGVLNIGDQFMFGPSFLINPVTEYKARTRNVYLPAGAAWYDLKSGKRFNGGHTINADAPYTEIPVFVKEGAIVPCGPAIEYVLQKPADPIRLFVYTGADGSFALYEDEGVNNNYEKGMFSTIPLKYEERIGVLTIGKREGEFPGMLKNRTFEIVWLGGRKAAGMDFQGKPDATVVYDGKECRVKCGK